MKRGIHLNKAFFKKCLSILDIVEAHAISYAALEAVLLHELQDDHEQRLTAQVCSYLRSCEFLKDTGRGIDLSACATVFAKAEDDSQTEALAFFECLYRVEAYRSTLRQCAAQKCAKTWLEERLDAVSLSLLTQTSLLLSDHDYYIIENEYRNNIFTIIGEYSTESDFLISNCLCAFYTKSVLKDHKGVLSYKNTQLSPIAYPKWDIIHRIIETSGVPTEREAIKGLQIFFKDTLFHECNHACVLCQLDLTQLLIASHIKPFRECAHIYEAIDYHNGLLLCRNHDFLFDQGYISFHNDGTLLISKQLEKHVKDNASAYQLHTKQHLPAYLLNEERKLFLSYHRRHIFLDEESI